MSLELQKKNETDFKKIYFRYRKDFPKIERRSYHRVVYTIKEGYSELLFLMDKHKIVGYAVINISSHYEHIIIDYIAIHSKYRNLGYGAKFLKLLFDYYSFKDGILGEVEIPALGETEAIKNIRNRRFQFYKRLGFQHIQTVDLDLWGQDYHLLYYPLKKELSDTKEIVKILLDLYRNFYNNGYQCPNNVEKHIKIIEK